VHEDDAERAVRAGLSLAQAERGLDVGSELQARTAIATGLVVVGDVLGRGAAQEQAVVGETPNLTARLQALAEPGSVVMDAGARRLTGGLFEYADQPASSRGFAAPIAAARVLGESTTASRFEALRAASTPFVGRDEELALLERRWQQAKAGVLTNRGDVNLRRRLRRDHMSRLRLRLPLEFAKSNDADQQADRQKTTQCCQSGRTGLDPSRHSLASE